MLEITAMIANYWHRDLLCSSGGHYNHIFIGRYICSSSHNSNITLTLLKTQPATTHYCFASSMAQNLALAETSSRPRR